MNSLWIFRKHCLVIVWLIACAGCGSSTPAPTSNSQDMLKGIVTARPPDTPESLAEKKAKLESNLTLAKQNIAQGKLDDAIALLEEAVGFDPKNREVLMSLVQASQKRSTELLTEDAWKSYRLIVQAGGYLRTLQELSPDLTPDEKRLFAAVLFDEACSHARSKRYDEFRGSLAAALSAGFADADRIKDDPAIKPLWEVDQLKEVLEQAVKSIAR